MTNTTAIAKMPLVQVQSVQQLLKNDQARSQLAAVAAKHMKPERMMRVVANAIRTTPKLQEAEPLSFLGALMQSASLGLEPNTTMGQAYLVPFKNNRKGVTEVQLIIGYKGYKALAWRSGDIEAMHADVVYTDDEEWSYSYGTDMHLRHRPGPHNGEKTHAYCFVKLKEGGSAFVVMPWEHITRVRDASQNWRTALKYGKTDASPWKTHEDVMAAKTAVRYLFQRGDVPMSVEVAEAMEVDHDSGVSADFTAFALDPSDGVQIEGEIVEGEDDAEQGQDAKPEPKAEEAPKPAQDTAPKADAKHQDAFDEISANLADGAPVSGTQAFYAQKIAAMEAEAPDLHKKLLDLFAQYEKEAAQ